jgi:hypothetical protein
VKVVVVVKVLHQLTNLVLAAACLVTAWGVATGRGWNMAASAVICLSTLATTLMQWKSSRGDQRIGRMDEQEYVLISALEAMERGMSQREWLDGYVEHSVAERMPLK